MKYIKNCIILFMITFLCNSFAQKKEFVFLKEELPHELFYTNKFSEEYFCKTCPHIGFPDCFMEQDNLHFNLAIDWFKSKYYKMYNLTNIEIIINTNTIVECHRNNTIYSYFSSCKKEIINKIKFVITY